MDACSLRTKCPINLIEILCRSVYFQELVGRAKLREEEEVERHRRAKDKFASMLRHLRKVTEVTTWDEFVAAYDQEPEFKAVSSSQGE